ncbi:MAG: hypothetical protein EBS38_02520 [Actinobacteria bacterium]|nr:hypothetical protein [Actinomycetota bacterium]
MRLSRNSSGWIALVKLPLGLGMTLGRGMTGHLNVRAWEWAAYDYADHDPEDYSPSDWERLQSNPQPYTRTAYMVEALHTRNTDRKLTV